MKTRCNVTYLRLTIQFLINANIKNIIFDLGGVIIDLDIPKTHRAFSSLSGISVEDIVSAFSKDPLFIDYEKGFLSDQEFRTNIRALLKINSSDEEINYAWNAMLLQIAPVKFPLLKKLKQQYNTFLLSNTNNIHLIGVNKIVYKTENKINLDDYFHKTYYSHIMGMRKPDKQIFEQVLDENNLSPGETLFLDDNLENVNAAQALGIRSIHIASNNMILSLFA